MRNAHLISQAFQQTKSKLFRVLQLAVIELKQNTIPSLFEGLQNSPQHKNPSKYDYCFNRKLLILNIG